MAPWLSTSREDLLAAASEPGFDTDLPLLVRRLIAETGRDITRLHLPGGSGTSAGGFDGVVVAGSRTTFVPEGMSVWELSVEQAAQTKAESDYSKRLAGPDGEDPSDITYIQVGLRPWTKASRWANDHRAEGRWRDVLAYNVDDLHTWLDAAPATTAWLAERLGKSVPGVHDAQRWWDSVWLPSTTVPLDAPVVLAGRKTAAADLLSAIKSEQTIITVGGGVRGDELRAFVAAALQTVPASDQVAARTLFVSSRDALLQLLDRPEPLVLVVGDAELVSNIPLSHKHRLVVPAVVGAKAKVEVPRIDGEIVAQLLLDNDFDHERAYALGTLARRSVPALRRALARYPDTLVPSWARSPSLILRRQLLLGSWDGQHSADRSAVEQFTGLSYAEFQDASRSAVSGTDDPFLGALHEQWHVVAPDDSWDLIAPHLTAADLDQFETIALQVLSEIQPQRDQFGFVNANDLSSRYSASLRRGIARTLAMLGASGELVTLAGGATGSDVARRVLSRLFALANEDSTYGLWGSLSDLLSNLAEAAPAEFIQAMRPGLQGEVPLHSAMFADRPPTRIGFPSQSPHLGFIRALEVLAWSPDHFDDAVDILAKLAAIDPGGSWSNRPVRSLEEIFSCWRPETSAESAHRLKALKRLLRNTPVPIRALLVTLIPNSHGFQSPHSTPKYRDWKREQLITRQQFRENVAGVVDLLLDDCGHDLTRLLPLIDKLDRISPTHRAAVATKLTAVSDVADDEVRAQLADALRFKIGQHRGFTGSDWALPEGELQTLDQVLASLEPQAPVLRLAWLFKSAHIVMPDQKRPSDLAAFGEETRRRRASAMGEILESGGLAAVDALAGTTDYPYLIGRALADQASGFDSEMLTRLAEPDSSNRQVAVAYLQTRLFAGGVSLRDELLAQTNEPSVQAIILNAASDPPSAWKALEDLPAAAEHYWANFNHYEVDNFPEHIITALHGLLTTRRLVAALQLVSHHAAEIDAAEIAELTVRVLVSLLEQSAIPPEFQQLSSYDFHRIFEFLARHREFIGAQQLANLEWQLFPLLDAGGGAPTLHATLSEEPSFFVELICRVYRREDEEPDGSQALSEERRRIATRAYEVLYTWRRCPGIGSAGTVEIELLGTWVSGARDRLSEAARLESGDSHIGQILAYAPPDQNGLFPPLAVRDLLEELQSDAIDRGLEMGIFNKRGVTSRGTTEGGTQERNLVQRYRGLASEAENWPRTRGVLRELAESYKHYARQVDERAERLRRGLLD
ncbi:hypothetical protein AB0A63_00235 [Lentzea sp. NPDC042327]|uniref:hypothetical protein n=1 Tax=Lentzea sp. NPDC042327 TaxID=3154801 RepID=UPI00340A0118